MVKVEGSVLAIRIRLLTTTLRSRVSQVAVKETVLRWEMKELGGGGSQSKRFNGAVFSANVMDADRVSPAVIENR